MYGSFLHVASCPILKMVYVFKYKIYTFKKQKHNIGKWYLVTRRLLFISKRQNTTVNKAHT